MIPADLVPLDCPWEVVLGIDPGTRVTGFGAVVVAPDGPRLVTCGVLRPPARAPIAQRLGHLQGELEVLITRLRPRTIAVESAYSARNVQSALRLGEARGMILATAARAGVEVDEIAPAQAKKAVLGHGGGSKEQVARMVATLLGRELDAPHDATDALAMALAHVARRRVSELLRRTPR